MAKLNDYTAVTRFDSNGILITDGSSGTRKISAKNAAIDLAGMVSSVQHRNIYGGRNLGSTVTDAQKAAISSGTFDNLYIGDYWTINGVQWLIADMDYYYNCGDTPRLSNHHLVIVPAACLYTHCMNSTNTTEGGYVGSLMYAEGLNQAKEQFLLAFPNMVLTYREYLINAVSNGFPSGGAWYNTAVNLMSEVQVFGTHHYHPMNNGSSIPTMLTISTRQFALFRLNSEMLNSNAWYWLRDVISDRLFADVGSFGGTSCNNASAVYGVRPYALIGV